MNGGYMCFALGCKEEVSGTFNPMCIRHSSVRNNTQWSTLASGSTAREYILTGGGRIVAGRMCRALHAGLDERRPVPGDLRRRPEPALALRPGRPQLRPDRAERRGRGGPDGLLGSARTAVLQLRGRRASRSRSRARSRSDFADNLAASQGDKVVASSNAEFGEIRFDYPDSRDGYENSRYSRSASPGRRRGLASGIMARTAFVDAGPTAYPLGVTYDGAIYYHEKGQSADGSAFAWFIESADSVWPDFKDQVGPVTVSVTSREQPQGDETSVTADADGARRCQGRHDDRRPAAPREVRR
jgi:hypothetical protein